jgi:hypothetical protein
MCLEIVPKEFKEARHLMALVDCDWGFILPEADGGHVIEEIRTHREDLGKCPLKNAIIAGVDYICSIRKAISERKFTQVEIAFLEKEIDETKQSINKCL